MTARWEKASRGEKFTIGFISLGFFMMWFGAQLETGPDIGLHLITTGGLLLAATVLFGLAYVVDWDK